MGVSGEALRGGGIARRRRAGPQAGVTSQIGTSAAVSRHRCRTGPWPIGSAAVRARRSARSRRALHDYEAVVEDRRDQGLHVLPLQLPVAAAGPDQVDLVEMHLPERVPQLPRALLDQIRVRRFYPVLLDRE